MKKFLVMATLLVATLTVSAQDYNWAIGLRGGGFSGLTAKQNMGGTAIEAGLSLYNGGFAIDGVYEWQEPVIGEGFHLYYGAGAYAQVAGEFFGLGAEAVIGLEYRLPINFPLAISLDYRPGINVLGDAGVQFWGGNFGLGIKYCF
jgi:hypothetical protein